MWYCWDAGGLHRGWGGHIIIWLQKRWFPALYRWIHSQLKSCLLQHIWNVSSNFLTWCLGAWSLSSQKECMEGTLHEMKAGHISGLSQCCAGTSSSQSLSLVALLQGVALLFCPSPILAIVFVSKTLPTLISQLVANWMHPQQLTIHYNSTQMWTRWEKTRIDLFMLKPLYEIQKYHSKLCSDTATDTRLDSQTMCSVSIPDYLQQGCFHFLIHSFPIKTSTAIQHIFTYTILQEQNLYLM